MPYRLGMAQSGLPLALSLSLLLLCRPRYLSVWDGRAKDSRVPPSDFGRGKTYYLGHHPYSLSATAARDAVIPCPGRSTATKVMAASMACWVPVCSRRFAQCGHKKSQVRKRATRKRASSPSGQFLGKARQGWKAKPMDTRVSTCPIAAGEIFHILSEMRNEGRYGLQDCEWQAGARLGMRPPISSSGATWITGSQPQCSPRLECMCSDGTSKIKWRHDGSASSAHEPRTAPAELAMFFMDECCCCRWILRIMMPVQFMYAWYFLSLRSRDSARQRRIEASGDRARTCPVPLCKCW